jgi:hypothetical protein
MWPTLLTSVLPGLLDKLFPDPQKAGEAKLKLLELQQSGQLAELKAQTELAQGQLAINQEEAKSPNPFVSGARPFILWTCGFAFAYSSVIEPIARFIAAVFFGYSGQFPVINTELTMQVLFGILGLGAFRTFEKTKGVSS